MLIDYSVCIHNDLSYPPIKLGPTTSCKKQLKLKWISSIRLVRMGYSTILVRTSNYVLVEAML